MEFGEQMVSPSSAPSALHMASPSASCSPAPPKTPSTKNSPALSPAGSSPLTACGQLIRTAERDILNLPLSSNGSPFINHPAFGLFTSSSGRSEFGGLGSLGLSTLAAHPQFGAIPDWWRPSEAHTREAALFPLLPGLHPVFSSALKSQDPALSQSHASGVIGAVNGRSAPSPTGKTKANCSPKSIQDLTQLQQKNIQKAKEKKPIKRPHEASSMSGSQSGSLSDSSSDDGESSSDPDDVDEEEEDIDEDEDPSIDSDDSDFEKESRMKRKVKRLTQDSSDSQKKRSCTSDGSTTEDSHCDIVPLTSYSSSNRLSQPQSPQFLKNSRMAEEDMQQHISVIQTTGLAVANIFRGKYHTEASSNHNSFSKSPNHLPPSSSPKHNSASSSSKALGLCSPSNSLSLCSSPKPVPLFSSTKKATLLATQTPQQTPRFLMPSLKHSQHISCMEVSSVPSIEENLLPPNNFKIKQPLHSKDPVQQVSSPPPKSHHWFKSSAPSSTLPTHDKHRSDPLSSHSLSIPHSNNKNLLLNGLNQITVQDAPLALITKPRSSTTVSSKPLLAATSPPYPMPINLSTGTKDMSGSSSSHKSAALSNHPHSPRKNKTTKSLHAGKSLSKTNSSNPIVHSTQGMGSNIHSSKDSDDSLGDECDDDDDDEDDDIDDGDSQSSLSESESTLDSDSDASDDEIMEQSGAEVSSSTDRTSLKLAEASPSTPQSSSSLDMSTNCSLLNLKITKPPSLPSSLLNPANTVTNLGALSNHSTISPAFAFSAMPGSGKRRRVTDERVLRLPLEFGFSQVVVKMVTEKKEKYSPPEHSWPYLKLIFKAFKRWQRETRIRSVAGRLQGEVAYFAPCGKKLRQYPDIMKYLLRNGISEISRDNFSFSMKIKVGDFYEAREGPEGLQWFLLTEEEIAPCIIAMDGRRSRSTKSEHQLKGDSTAARQWQSHPVKPGVNNSQDVCDAKLLRKLEAQEIARQAAHIKMMRKLEKQAMAQAAKEARKQQAIIAAEERRKKREQIKIMKQQEKIKRIQQIRMEKELRAQQILETKRKKREETVNAKMLEAAKRNKEREMRRLHAVILKHQEMERHRLDMERERRRQHMMLMKAVEARKKAEEKERLKRVKKDEKRLNKERKLELRRLELEKAKELKKPNEDMCLADHKPLPELSQIPSLALPGSTLADCLMVLQFLHSFGKVLRLDINLNTLNLSDLQEGLLNTGDSMGKVQDLLVSMVSAAVCDPGIPAGHKNKTALGDHVTNVVVNRDNMSEILQIYMEAHCEQTELAALARSLRTKAFQAHSPSQKASLLAFLVNELCCSKAVISEIDKNIDYMTNLRKDKWAVEGKLRKLRRIHAKKTGKKDGAVGGDNSHTFVIAAARNKSKRKEGDSDEEEDEDDDSEDQGDDDDEEEEESGGKRGRKADMCEEEDISVDSASMEELEKQIEKTYKQHSEIRQKLFDSSLSLRSMTIGQDRYKRWYWVLPQCGGIFVEGMESCEGYEEVEKEIKQRPAQLIMIKEEHLGEPERLVISGLSQSPGGEASKPESQRDKESHNLFLQKPGSFSKLSRLLGVDKLSHDSDIVSHRNHHFHSAQVSTATSHLSYPSSQTATAQRELIDKTNPSAPSLCGPQLKNRHRSIPHDDQLPKTLKEQNSLWFSLLPRSPCDEASFISGLSPPASTSPVLTSGNKSPSSLSSGPSAADRSSTPSGINNMPSSVSQHFLSGILQSRPTPCDVSSSGSSLPSVLDMAPQHAEGNSNKRETPEPPNDRPACASLPAVEATRTQDYSNPQPITKEMLCGWWRVSGMEELHSLVKALHNRGIRERVLQKQIQKHMEYMTQLCANSKQVVDVAQLEKQEVSEAMVESWCVEEQAMEVDISLLKHVEVLERKVVSANLQIKGWRPLDPQSEREDLVYHEHKPFSSSPAPETYKQIESSQEELPGSVLRRLNNPLDIAVIRLAELERNIDRSCEEASTPGMRLWHKALWEVRSSAQLSLCIQQLQKSIPWERSIMKVLCQLCQKGDNEELLLLCDSCDKGCHTYCHKPRISTVPDGNWFCPMCVAKESGQSPRSKRHQNRTAGGGKKGSEVKRNIKPSVAGELIREEAASSNDMPKKGPKEFKKGKGDDSPHSTQGEQDSHVSCAKKAKTAKDNNTSGLGMCRVLMAELEAHRDAWPFLTPVNHKSVPGYRKVIKKPMDFSTIREKLTNNQYLNLESFIVDVNLVFENCEKFNEDDSQIGRAGHRMRRFFDKRWTELLQ